MFNALCQHKQKHNVAFYRPVYVTVRYMLLHAQSGPVTFNAICQTVNTPSVRNTKMCKIFFLLIRNDITYGSMCRRHDRCVQGEGGCGERDNLRDPGVNVGIILKNGSSISGMGACTGLNSLRIWTGFCEFGNEPLGSIKCREFLQ